MSDARQNGDRRLGAALVLLLLALGLQAQCSLITPDAQGAEAQVDVCNSGDLYVRGNGDEVVACVDGQLQPMLTLDESTTKAESMGLWSLGFGVVVGFGFGFTMATVRRTR